MRPSRVIAFPVFAFAMISRSQPEKIIRCVVCKSSPRLTTFAPNPGRNKRVLWPRCKQCSVCRSCCEYKDLRSFHRDKEDCIKCSRLGSSMHCEVCDETKGADKFRKRGRRTDEKESAFHKVCLACEDIGYSFRDVRNYQCYGCGIKGHKRFLSHQLSHQRERGSEILCIECTRRERLISLRLRFPGSHRCTCPGSKTGRKPKHLPWNKKCELYSASSAQIKWPGKNKGLSQEDFLFHEHVVKRRKPRVYQVEVNLKSISFQRASSDACHWALTCALYQVDWSWNGFCHTCQQDYSTTGSCQDSKPKPLAGISFRSDNELAQMIADLGGASMLVYTKQIERMNSRHHQCPRCEAIDTWACEWEEVLTDRLKYIAQQIVNGQTDPDVCLTELPLDRSQEENATEDLLFSHRLRSIVLHIRSSFAPNKVRGPVAIMVPSGLTCYMLWQLLCFLQPVWRRERMSGIALDQMVEKMTAQIVGPTRSCVRYHPGIMDQDELQQIVTETKQVENLVVVVCTETKAAIPPGTFEHCNVLCWNESLCRSAFDSLGRKSRLTFMYEKWESEYDAIDGASAAKLQQV